MTHNAKTLNSGIPLTQIDGWGGEGHLNIYNYYSQ